MVKFPVKFEVRSASTNGISTSWTGQRNHLSPIPLSIPAEFSGPGSGYSPEDLFALAVLNCIIASFKVHCEKAKVTFDQIQGKALLTVDKLPDSSSIAMAHIDIFLNITGVSERDTARKLLDAAIKDCPVNNSIKSGKTFHIDIAF